MPLPTLLILLAGCGAGRDPLANTREGPAEADGPRPTANDDTGAATSDTSGDTASTTWGTDTGDTEKTKPEPVGQVCYLGPASDASVCLPVVDYTDSWGDAYVYPDPLDGDAQYTIPSRFVDLSTIDPSTMLAPNFQLDELMQEWKGRFGVIQPHLVQTLQGMREDSGGPLNINSGYRSVSYNASVGGATWSRHMYGDAADLTSDVLDLDGLAALCDAFGADYIGMYTAHVHCDWRNSPLDPAFYDSGSNTAHSAGPLLPALDAELVQVAGAWTAPASGFDEGEPLRQWTARAPDGTLMNAARGATYVPPLGAIAVEVIVGGQVHRQVNLR